MRFSIIMPVYNAEQYLPLTLRHLASLNQSLFNILFIDDGSNDGSAALLQKYCDVHANSRLIYSGHNGVSAARNRGIEQAEGEYILFLDADDRYCPEIFDVLQGCIDDNYTDIIVFGARVINYDCEYVLTDIKPRNIVYREFKPQVLFYEEGSNLYVWNCAYKTAFLQRKKIKFDEEISLGEDRLFQFSAMPYADSIQFISNKLYEYHYLKYDTAVKAHISDRYYRSMRHIELVDKIIKTLKKSGRYAEMQSFLYLWVYDFLYADLMSLEKRKFREASKFLNTVLKNNSISIKKMPIPFKKKVSYLSICNGWARAIRKMVIH